MQQFMLKAKIHRATVTEADIAYEGSLSIDRDLMDAVGVHEFEQVHVYNITNGERFETYIIAGARGSGVIGLNGAAARKGMVGDQVILVTYCLADSSELQDYKPKIVLLDSDNKIKRMIDK